MPLRVFWSRLLLYLMPFALPVIGLSSGLIYVGESLPLAAVVALQSGEDPVLYRPQYGSRDLQFKTLSVNTRRPEVVALGSSRVLQFRAGMFTQQPESFYNAGGPAWTLDQLTTFVNDLHPNAAPKLLIIGIDPPWFNADYVPDELPPSTSDFAQIFLVNRGFTQDLLAGRSFDLTRVMQRVEPAHGGLALGMRAILDGHGFRNDGSEQYGDFLVAGWLTPEAERQRHMQWMREGTDMYVHGADVDAAALAQFDTLLAECQARGITVIGFMPPYMPRLWERMQARGDHAYVAALTPQLAALHAEYGFAFFDFSVGTALDATETDFFDGWHGSERVYLRLLGQMASARPDLLTAYTDPAALAAVDANAGDTFRVYGP